jgi:hypothetical protein
MTATVNLSPADAMILRLTIFAAMLRLEKQVV